MKYDILSDAEQCGTHNLILNVSKRLCVCVSVSVDRSFIDFCTKNTNIIEIGGSRKRKEKNPSEIR
jgi:hypothetical protein